VQPAHLRYVLQLILYSTLWLALSHLAYQTFCQSYTPILHPGPYSFLIGLVYLNSGTIRYTLQSRPHADRHDPLTLSLHLVGLLLILYSNLSP
jgi:phosphoglycerol transferase MdoB-like AlkP superfamily enzyme